MRAIRLYLPHRCRLTWCSLSLSPVLLVCSPSLMGPRTLPASLCYLQPQDKLLSLAELVNASQETRTGYSPPALRSRELLQQHLLPTLPSGVPEQILPQGLGSFSEAPNSYCKCSESSQIKEAVSPPRQVHGGQEG